MALTPKAALLTLASPNFEALVQFYTQLLDRSPEIYRPNVYAEFNLPGVKLGIFRPKTPIARQSPSQVPVLLGMGLCLEVENLEAAIAHLTQLGYPPVGEIRTASHGREIDAFDPDGNWLILHQSGS